MPRGTVHSVEALEREAQRILPEARARADHITFESGNEANKTLSS